MLKLYCYADETGQDTKGRLFLVSIVLAEKDNVEKLQKQIIEIEKKTKGSKKWTKTKNIAKKKFLEEVLLRLADAMAGFIRDYFENKKYLDGLISADRFKRFFKEIQ